MNVHAKRVLAAVVVIGGCVAVGLGIFYAYFYVPHFAEVTPTALYRSGQPGEGDLERLHSAYGIRTVVNLRERDEQTGEHGLTFDDEVATAEKLGMSFVHLPMPSKHDPDPNVMRRWLEIISDEKNHPVLVHCKRGVDRTGLLVALYRAQREGWSLDRALDEAVEQRLDPEDCPAVRQSLEAFMKRQSTTTRTATQRGDAAGGSH